MLCAAFFPPSNISTAPKLLCIIAHLRGSRSREYTLRASRVAVTASSKCFVPLSLVPSTVSAWPSLFWILAQSKDVCISANFVRVSRSNKIASSNTLLSPLCSPTVIKNFPAKINRICTQTFVSQPGKLSLLFRERRRTFSIKGLI